MPSVEFPISCRRRPTPYGNQTDYRMYELNKRLQNWTEVRDVMQFIWRDLEAQQTHPAGSLNFPGLFNTTLSCAYTAAMFLTFTSQLPFIGGLPWKDESAR